MFTLVADESSQKLGIEVHKKRRYEFETGFLSGQIWHDSTDKDFSVLVSPNYTFLATITPDDPKTLKHEFNAARGQSVSIGSYGSLDVVDEVLRTIDGWYKEILKTHGAKNRFLKEEGNSFHLVKSRDALPSPYGDVIIQARNLHAFEQLRNNEILSYETVVGKIMPMFLTALGFPHVHIEHDTSRDGYGEVRFILQETGVFSFFKPQEKHAPVYMERYSYRNGDYHRSFAGEATGDVIKTMMYDWLIDAAQEMQLLQREDLSTYLDELALDVKLKRPPTAANVVQLGQRRQP